MTAGMEQWETRRMTRNYGTHKKDKRGTRGGSRERENQSECTNWLLLLLQGRAAEEEEFLVDRESGVEYWLRVLGTGMRAGRMQQDTHMHTDTHTHTHTEIGTHMRDAGKPWEKLTYWCWSKKVTRSRGKENCCQLETCCKSGEGATAELQQVAQPSGSQLRSNNARS